MRFEVHGIPLTKIPVMKQRLLTTSAKNSRTGLANAFARKHGACISEDLLADRCYAADGPKDRQGCIVKGCLIIFCRSP